MKNKEENRGQKRAFTLAEVLITLVIIGVIAALTVPTLIQNTQKQEYVSALKKAYSTLSQATLKILEEDEIKANNLNRVKEQYKKHLNVAKDCGRDTQCGFAGDTKDLQKNIVSNAQELANGESWYASTTRLALADGTVLLFHWRSGWHCSTDSKSYSCYHILVDLNGPKAPNIVGRDIFGFDLYYGKIIPIGSVSSNPCKMPKGDFGCTAKVLAEGAMNY